MAFPDLLGKLKQQTKNVADRVGSMISGARVVELPGVDPFTVVPSFLGRALQKAGAAAVGDARQVSAGKGPIGSAAKGDVPLPNEPGVVAVSTHEDTGLVQWHIPMPGETAKEAAVWVHREAEAGRRVGVFRLPPTPGELPTGAVRGIETLYKTPGLKRLPRQSAHPLAPKPLGDPATLKQLPLEFLADPGPLGPLPGSERTLIIVHGILDRVYGFALAPLLVWGDLLGKLQTMYGGRVFGFDHPTLSDRPEDNASALLRLLPDGLSLDLLCHSRGGLVVRALLEDPELRRELDGRNIKIGKVIFMAAANQGSPLAAPEHLADLLSIFASFGNASRVPVIHNAVVEAGDLMLAAARVVGRLPGVAALIPGSGLIARLNASPVETAGRYFFIRASFSGTTEPLLVPLEHLSDRGFGGERSDLVVPFAGATNVGPRRTRPDPPPLPGLGDGTTAQGHFHHLNLLDSPHVRAFIVQTLGAP